MTPYVVCKRIVKVYRVGDHELVALRGIEFEMEKGEMVAIIGPSGAGKSSLLNLLGGLDTPTAGQLIVGDRNVLELRGRKLADYRLRQVGFVWQQVERNLLAHRSAFRNVTLPMVLAGVSLRERRTRTKELLEAVGLKDQWHKRPAALSGGQQQRVAIAVALANQPGLLLADEPTGALDRETAKQVMLLLNDLRARLGLTILMVTHDMDMAGYADRVLTLRDGALGQVDEERPSLDDHGRMVLPETIKTRLAEMPAIAVEIRPEGVLLRAEADDSDPSHALHDSLTEDAPPPPHRWRFLRRRTKVAS
ncbi:MAG: ABC transporter ATP-binding protein [Anaerolineae bacterium]|nr:ABC transporter ATP-binding protein [Anaerolineae bacterium]